LTWPKSEVPAILTNLISSCSSNSLLLRTPCIYKIPKNSASGPILKQLNRIFRFAQHSPKIIFSVIL